MDCRRSLQERKYCYLNKTKTINPAKHSNNIHQGKIVDEGERNTKYKNNTKEKSNSISKTNFNINGLMDILQSDRGDSIVNKIGKKHEDKIIKKNASYIVKPIEVNYPQNNGINNNDKDKINPKVPKSIGHVKKNSLNKLIPKDNCKMDLQRAKPGALTLVAKRENLRTIINKDTPEQHKTVARRKPNDRILNNKKCSNTEDIISNTEATDNHKRNIKPKSLIVNVPHSVADINTNGTDSKEDYIDPFIKTSDASKMKHSNNNKSTETKNENGSNYYSQKKILNKNENGDSKRDVRTVSLNDKNKASQKSISIPGSLNRKTRIPKLINSNSNKRFTYGNRKDNSVLNVSLGNRKRWQKRGALSPKSPKRNMDSPPTEVAKWAPNSINKHTKLYYEAWVNTTLAAVSKGKYGKISLEKPNIQDFRKYLEDRARSPELMYEDYSDRRFTGTIKVNHKK